MIQPSTTTASTIPAIAANPQEFTLYCTNCEHLLPFQQEQLRNALQAHFWNGEISEYRGIIKISVKFATPIHVGVFMRRAEMLIFKIRCNINAFLRFETSFRYE